MHIDAKKSKWHNRAMNSLTPAIIRDRATKAHTPISTLLKRAGIQNSTFWRWEGGHIVSPHPVTLQKIGDALDAIEKEKTATR